MTVNTKQYEYLNAMGISLWQSKNNNKLDVEDDEQNKRLDKDIALSLTQLAEKTLFNDILCAMNLSVADVSIQGNTLNCGFINWALKPNKDIDFSGHCLTTPTLNELAASAKLKRKLWHTITQSIVQKDIQ